MEDTLAFQSALSEALDSRKEWLDRTVLPQLKDEFRIFQSSFFGLYTLLLKKGVLHEDPYASDQKIGEVECPSESPFSESAKIDEMSIRLSNFSAQLDFLVNYYQYSTEFINLDRIKRLAALTKYFAWNQLSTNSPNINTRTLVELIGMVKSGNDSLSIGLVNEATGQLDKVSKTIFRILKDISAYHRENYKLEFRLRVMGQVKIDAESVFARHDDTLRLVKRKFAESMSDRPFYAELVEEVLKEDYSSDGPGLRDRLIAVLSISQERPKERQREVSYKSTLLDGVRALGSLSDSLSDSLRKLDDNSSTIEAGKDGFWDKFRKVIRQMLNRDDEDIHYDVEYFDAVKSSSKVERLNFTQFKADGERIARILSGLNVRTSNVIKRLESLEDEQLLETLAKYIDEVQRIHKHMVALDTFFKSEVPREDRDRMRGIKPELSVIRNGIIKANQKRHEYVSLKEEREQMKRLGIKSE